MTPTAAPSRRCGAGSARSSVVRFVTILTVVALAVVGISVIPSQQAEAAAWNVHPTDGGGLPVPTLYADQALYASFNTDVAGGTICVVAGDVTSAAGLSCKNPAWGSPNYYIAIGTHELPLEAPMLPVGTWRLLATDNNGVNPNYLSETFTVLPCRRTCDPAPAQQEIDKWKAAAAPLAAKYKAAGAGLTLYSLYGAVSAGRGLYLGLGGGLIGAVAGGVWGYYNFNYSVDTDALALSILSTLIDNLAHMYTDIVNDPPSNDYATVADPEFLPIPLTGDSLWDSYARATMRAAAYGKASRIAFERFQGAVAASAADPAAYDAAAQQAKATSDFTFAMNNELRTLQQLQPKVAALSVLADPTTTAEDLAHAVEFRQNIADHGFTTDQLDQLHTIGLSDEGIAQLRSDFAAQDLSGVDPTVSPRALLTAATADLPDSIEAFDAFGRTMSVAGAEQRKIADATPVNHAPSPSFTASATSGLAPLAATFTDTSTDADGDALTRTWSVDGTDVGTGATLAHTFADAGNYVVTLSVDDGTDQASAQRTITVSPRTDPAASFTVGTPYDAAALVNGSSVVSVTNERSGYPAANVVGPTTADWYTDNGATTEQSVVVRLAGDGSDLVDRVRLTGTTATTGARSFSLALAAGADPSGPFTTVLDHETLARQSAAQEFAFPAQTARFAKLTVHDNYGGSYLRLHQWQLPTVHRDGGVVSLAAGPPATVTSVTSDMNLSYVAPNVLLDNSSSWRSENGASSPQRIRIHLGGDGPHTVSKVTLRGANSTASVKDFTLALSTDGSTFTPVVTSELAKDASDQEFTFAPTAATDVEFTAHSTWSATYYLLNRIAVFTDSGLNVADGAGVGAAVVEATSQSASPQQAIDYSSSTYWRSARNAATDQALTLVLRNGELATIDRVSVQSTSYRPKDVTVLVSADGVTYSPVASRTLYNVSDTQTITFAPTDARFVRLAIADGYAANYVQVNTVRAISTSRGGGDAVPFADLSAPGTSPIDSWEWDFGDGATSSERNPVHHFAAPGTYLVTLTVRDSDGRTDSVTHPYTVPSVGTLTIDTPTDTVNEGTATSLTISNSASQIVEWQWDLGYTTATTTTRTYTAKFPDQGTYTVSVRGLTADLLLTPVATRTFTVLNVAPTVNPGGALHGMAGNPVTPTTTVADPADAMTCVWQWGDGTADQTITSCTTSRVRVPHTYAEAGTYTATVTVDDGDGGTTSATLPVTIAKRPTFLHLAQTQATGADLAVRLRVVDSATGAGVPGATVSVQADGKPGTPGTSDGDGFVDVVLPGAAGATVVSAASEATAVYLPASVTRNVHVPSADIVFVVDESASMGSYQANVISNLQNIAQGLGSHLDYHLGLAGYASGSNNGFGRIRTPLSDDVAAFYEGLRALQVNSESANGYEGIVAGLGNDMNFRDTAATCVVLISDAAASEIPSAPPKTTKDAALAALTARQATLFSVIASDAGTQDAYGPGAGLAGATGGDWWTIGDFSKDPSGVLGSLVSNCVQHAQTPDLSLALEGPTAPVAAGDEAQYTLTVTNAAAVDVTGAQLVYSLPADADVVSVSDDGSVDPTGTTVSWPTFDVAAGEHATRSVRVTFPLQHSAPGVYTRTSSATVADDGASGAEATLDNNTADASTLVRVPELVDVGIAASTPTPEGALPGGELAYRLSVTNLGNVGAHDVDLVSEIPSRYTVLAVDAAGWDNPHGTDLIGPHPDGSTPGSWLHLTRGLLEGTSEITLTVQVSPLAQDGVTDDAGSLGSALPELAQVGDDDVPVAGCVSAAADSDGSNDCATVTVPLNDVAASVTARLSGGITYLIVSVATTASLSAQPVTLTWTPAATASPSSVVLPNLIPGKQYVLPWPGGEADADGQAIAWPGWRISGEALVLDPAAPAFAWRAPSSLQLAVPFGADSVELGFTVNYREVVPEIEVLADTADQAGTGGPTGQAAQADQADQDGQSGDAGTSTQLPTTGPQNPGGMALLGLLLLLLGAGLTTVRRRRVW